jgi:hypothetical protein
MVALERGEAARLGALLAAASERARHALVRYAASGSTQAGADPATDAARRLASRLVGGD